MKYFILLLVLALPGFSLRGGAAPLRPAALTASSTALAANYEGAAAFTAGDFAGAITAFRRAVQIDPARLVFVTNLATSYQKAGRWADAETLLIAKRRVFLAPNDQKKLAIALAENHFFWATTLRKVYRYQEALAHLQAALAIDRVYRPSETAVDFYALGSCCYSMARYAEAIAYYQAAQRLWGAFEDRRVQAVLFSNIGTMYTTMGQYAKAVQSLQQALEIGRSASEYTAEDQKSEANTLNNLGLAYSDLAQYDLAVAAYQQALSLRQATEDREGEAKTLGNLGVTAYKQTQYEQAIAFFLRALPIQQEKKDRDGEATTLGNLGAAYDRLHQYENAIGFYQQALGVIRDARNREGEAVTCGNLMRSWDALNSPQLAIWYGKQSVAISQDIRGDLHSLDTQTQQAYLAPREANYRQLAQILIDQGRLSEGLQVLQMLKQQEFFDFLSLDPQGGLAPQSQVRLTPRETLWQRRYALLDHASSLELFLDALTAAFRASPGAEGSSPLASEMSNLSNTLRKMAPGTVAVYTIVQPERLGLIVITPDSQRAATTEISSADLYRKVLAFRNALQDPTRDPRPLAQELYKIIVGPLEADLKAAHATALLWSLDDALRYLPMPALYDGKRYLVERYDNALLTLAAPAQPPAPLSSLPWTGLGLGVSLAHPGFDALPGVRAELSGIFGSVVPGTALIDSQFTQRSFLAGLKHRNHPLVHIASHFSLSGRDTDSFLLLGDGGHLSMAQMKADPNVFEGVDLLTLSACNTAIEVRSAGGKEVEGFGALAQRLGARSVLASLWPVADASTPTLMREFYRLRHANPKLGKAAGLRQAQLELLRGSVTASSAPSKANRAKRAKVAGAANMDLPLFATDPKAPYAHPYYWAPFVLIGNPQ